MATKLYLLTSQLNAISNYRDMTDTPEDAAVDTAVVATAGGGSNLQWTVTASGELLAWISGKSPAGGWTLGLGSTMTFNIWAQESNMNANAGGRARVYKRTAAGVETEIAGPFDDGVEFGATGQRGVFNWTGNAPSATSFAEDDRIIARYFITGVGTMATGYTCTLGYSDDVADADGDTWFQLTETVAFKSESQSLDRTNTEDLSALFADVASRAFTGARSAAESVAGSFLDALNRVRGTVRALLERL